MLSWKVSQRERQADRKRRKEQRERREGKIDRGDYCREQERENIKTNLRQRKMGGDRRKIGLGK